MSYYTTFPLQRLKTRQTKENTSRGKTPEKCLMLCRCRSHLIPPGYLQNQHGQVFLPLTLEGLTWPEAPLQDRMPQYLLGSTDVIAF